MKRTMTLWVIMLLIATTAALANPLFTVSSSTQSITAGQTQTFDLGHTTVDEGALVAALEDAPSFVTLSTLDANNQRLTVSPTATEPAGSQTFNVTIKDDGNVLSKHLFTLTVLEAPVVGLNSSISVSLGNTRQAASNPEARDEEDRIVSLPGTIELRNEGTSVVTGITASVTPLGFSTTELNFTFDSTGLNALPASLNPGEIKTVGFNVHIPGSLDAVDDKNLRETAITAANIVISGTISGKTSTTITQLNLQRENQLEVDKVKICVNDRCKSVVVLDEGARRC